MIGCRSNFSFIALLCEREWLEQNKKMISSVSTFLYWHQFNPIALIAKFPLVSSQSVLLWITHMRSQSLHLFRPAHHSLLSHVFCKTGSSVVFVCASEGLKLASRKRMQAFSFMSSQPLSALLHRLSCCACLGIRRPRLHASQHIRRLTRSSVQTEIAHSLNSHTVN